LLFLHRVCGFGYAEVDEIPFDYAMRLLTAYNTHTETVAKMVAESLQPLKGPAAPNKIIPNLPPPPGAHK